MLTRVSRNYHRTWDDISPLPQVITSVRISHEISLLREKNMRLPFFFNFLKCKKITGS